MKALNSAVLVLCFSIAVTFGAYRLTETPPTWMDEGIIVQVARNMASAGVHALQVAPGGFLSAGFVTTSYTVTWPVSLAFKAFGVGLLEARLVMLGFIGLLMGATALYLRRNAALWAFGLLPVVTFAPLYGHGKNVLGEIPGLAYLFLGLCLLRGAEGSGKRLPLAAFFLGLAAVTKPVFILLLPALGVGALILRRRASISIRSWVAAVLAFLVPVAVWLVVQFEGDSAANIISIYANPHSNPPLETALANLRRFASEAQPAYFLALLAIWTASLWVRRRRKERWAASETVAFVFTWLVFGAYLRTMGYYRYFFLGQFVALVHLWPSLVALAAGRRRALMASVALLVLLSTFQVHKTLFNSWVADYAASERTSLLERHFTGSEADSYFVYQAPEAVLFLPHDRYYQYLRVTPTIAIGEDSLDALKRGIPDEVIVGGDVGALPPDMLELYQPAGSVDRYQVFVRKDR